MKNSPIAILACVCLVLAAFLGGMYVGRNMTGGSIQISVLSSQASTQSSESVPASFTAVAGSTPASSAPQNDGKININTADLLTLMSLDGIGEIYAQRIIDYRSANGPFAEISEIMNVEGIGTKRFEAIKDYITTGG